MTASATGLTSAATNVRPAIAGAPSQIAVSAAQTVTAGSAAEELVEFLVVVPVLEAGDVGR